MFKGKGLFVFSDPGGAKPILSYIFLNKIDNYLIISDRVYDFFNYFNLDVNIFDRKSYKELFESFKPDYIFTGTSYTSLIELLFIEEAKRHQIKTISFIDHYTSYPDRFILNGKSTYPNEIYLTDEKALGIALSYELDKFAKLKITGNFFHQFLKHWIPDIPRTKVIPGLIIPDDKKIVVFAPDPLSNVGGKLKFGFDETDIWNILAEVIKSDKFSNIYLVLKLHPNQDSEYLKNHVANSSFPNVYYADFSDSISLTFYSDVVVGMYSSFLIEASKFNKKILRILPDLSINDSLSGMNIGSISRNVGELNHQLNKIFK